jgi:integrase/recombinase XerD
MARQLKAPRTRELVPVGQVAAEAVELAVDSQDSLAAWIREYGRLEAASNALNTVKAKARDLAAFLAFMREKVKSDHPDDWTKPVTTAFLRHLENNQGKRATTVNRVLATLRHFAGWLKWRRLFLAGDPTYGVQELVTDEPAWKGLDDVEVMRLKSACEQLVKIKDRQDQNGIRDKAIFLVLLNTGLRVSELVALDRHQYTGKHFQDVKRKGRTRTAKVFLPPEARDALDAYLALLAAEQPGPLFRSKSGKLLERQHVHVLLKAIAAQAKSRLADNEQIRLSAHVLRHTFLRKLARAKGVEFAMEASGHSSAKYIFRYIKPSDDEKEEALSALF